MQFGTDQFRHQAITRTEDVVADHALEGQLLPTLLALDEEAQLLRKFAQRLDHITRRIAARTARTARHALAAIPDRIALQQRLDGLVVARLHDIDDLPGVVVVELGGGTDARTDAAVHARMQPFPHPHILHQHIEILAHRHKKTFAEAKVGIRREPRSSINT